jgi:hypothetical protein
MEADNWSQRFNIYSNVGRTLLTSAPRPPLTPTESELQTLEQLRACVTLQMSRCSLRVLSQRVRTLTDFETGGML